MLDEPFVSTSIYAQYRVYQMAAKRQVKVLLGGQAADGILAGNPVMLTYRLAGYVRTGNLWRAAQLLQRAALYGEVSTSNLVRIALVGMTPTCWLRRFHWRKSERRAVPPWLDGEWLKRRGVDVRPYAVRIGQRRNFHDAGRVALLNHTTPRLLRYEDRSSMAHSVESRVPFLTPRLVEFVQRLPESFLIDDYCLTKSVFRRAMRGIVPDAVLDRRDKIGFTPPQGKWLTALDPWVRETLSPGSASRLPCLRSDEMIRHWENAGTQGHRIDWILLRWLNAIHWTKVYNVEWD